MKKIVIVSFYELKEYLMYIKELFLSYHYEVYHYPLFQYAYDANDKLENYKEHMVEHLSKIKPDVVLWWFLDVPSDVFKHVKACHPNIHYIMYNSDDPCNFNTETLEKAKIFDMVVSICQDNLKKYTMFSGVEKTHFSPPGYNPNYFFPYYSPDVEVDVEDRKYISDISIICYTLFDDPYFKFQQVPRKTLFSDIAKYCEENGMTFKLYGSPVLKEYFPDNYIDDIDYFNQNKVYNMSKICLSTHPFCTKHTSFNFSDMRILGSGGLLLTDKVKGLDKFVTVGKECLVLEEEYIKQIDRILNNYDKYLDIRKAGHELSKAFTWDSWVEAIHLSISEKFFNPELYKRAYNVEDDNAWDHFRTRGVKDGLIPFQFIVPKNFQHKDYAELNNLNTDDVDQIYIHWFMNGKNPDYLVEKGGSSRIDIGGLNLSPDQWFIINTAFTKVEDFRTRDDGLELLQKVCRNNPKLKVNDALAVYLNLCDM